jgi:hypothetical protein
MLYPAPRFQQSRACSFQLDRQRPNHQAVEQGARVMRQQRTGRQHSGGNTIMAVFKQLSVTLIAALTILTATTAAAVECYPEIKVKADLDSKGYVLHKSATSEKLELFAYASEQEKRWLIFARPPQDAVQGAPSNETMLCPLDGDDGDVAAMEASPYYLKFFGASAEAKPGVTP